MSYEWTIPVAIAAAGIGFLSLEFTAAPEHLTAAKCVIQRVSLNRSGTAQPDWILCGDTAYRIEPSTRLKDVRVELRRPVSCDLELHFGRFGGEALLALDKVLECRG